MDWVCFALTDKGQDILVATPTGLAGYPGTATGLSHPYTSMGIQMEVKSTSLSIQVKSIISLHVCGKR